MPHGIAVGAASLPGLVEQLERAGWGRLGIDSELARQKVTIYAPGDTPRESILTALAELLWARWVTSGRAGEARVLSRTAEYRAWLAERRRRRARFRNQAISEQGDLLLAGLREARSRSADGDSAHALAGMVASLPPPEIDRLIATPSFTLWLAGGVGLNDAVPAIRISYDVASPAQRRVFENLPERDQGPLNLSGHHFLITNQGDGLWAKVIGPMGPAGDLQILRVARGPAMAALDAMHLEAPDSPPAGSPGGPQSMRSAADRAAARRDAARAVGARLDATRPARLEGHWRDLDYAEACREFSRLVGVPVVADYYTQPARLSLRISGLRASELLRALSEAFQAAPALSNGILRLRTVWWAAADEWEIDDRVVQRFLHARMSPGDRASGFLTLWQVAELSLPIRQEQSGTLRFCRGRGRGGETIRLSDEGSLVLSEWRLLRFLAALPAGDRVLLPGAGLPLGRAAAGGAPFQEWLLRAAPWVADRPNWRRLRIKLAPEPIRNPEGNTLLTATALAFVDPDAADAVVASRLLTWPWSAVHPDSVEAGSR